MQQAIALIQDLDEGVFTRTSTMYPSGIGSHLRHCMDHYCCFLDGVGNGAVDYDCRDRNPELELSPQVSARRLNEICHGLERLEGVEEQELRTKMDCGSVEEQPFSQSSLKRELQFLVSHTVHHYALISMIMRDQGLDVPPGFGVAPSTLKFQEQSLSCAQ